MKVVYHRGALRDLDAIFDYVARDDAGAADRVIRRIKTVVDLLSASPELGRPGRRGVRFLSIAGLPYIVIYRIRHQLVQVVAVFHTARNRKF